MVSSHLPIRNNQLGAITMYEKGCEAMVTPTPPKLGMPAMIEVPQLEDNIRLACELGLDFVEINSNLPIYQARNMDVKHAQALLEQNNIFLTLHLDEYLHVTDLDPRVAEVYRIKLLEEIERAKQLRIPVLNLHLLNGVHYTLPDKRVYVFDFYVGAFLQGIRDLRAMCEEAVGDSGIVLCIENLDGYCNVVVEAIDMLMESPVFGLTWDVGHDYRAHGQDATWLKRHAKRVCHMHLHDANVRSDHLALGTGEINISEKLRFIEACQGTCLVEVKTPESLRQSIAYLRALYQSTPKEDA